MALLGRLSRLALVLLLGLTLMAVGTTGKMAVPPGHAPHGASTASTPASCKQLHPIQAEMLPFVHDMLTDAYHAYFENAFPHDVLRSLSPDDWREELGGYGLTLIDALDMLAIMGRHDVFRKLAKWLEENVNFDIDVTVSAFETNIRTVGGFLSAHLFYEEGFVPVVPEEHDYKGGLLALAVDMGTRLLGSYKSALGLLFNAVNLKNGVAENETDVIANAAAGTFSMEMMLLSRLTGNPQFETAGRWAQQLVHDLRVRYTSLMGDHIRGYDGTWVSAHTSVGSAVDSTLEYNLKSHVLTGGVDEWERYEVERRAAHKFIGRNGFYLHTSCAGPTRWARTVHESLAAFYPGLLLLGGQRREATSLLWTSHALWRRYGALAEMTDLASGQPTHTSESYPLRPEHFESIYFLYRTTRDPAYLQMGREAALSLHLRTRTAFGFSGLKHVEKVDGRLGLEGDMESFLLTETFKYLYLLFDECNPLHAADSQPVTGSSPTARDSASGTVGWVFTTEAHPIPNRLEWWEESAPWQRRTPAKTPAAKGKHAARELAVERQARRPAYGALFPVLHSNATAAAFDQSDALDPEDVAGRTDLLHSVIAATITAPERAHLGTAIRVDLANAARRHARPYTESRLEARRRHIRGLRGQVESELMAGGVRGGFTSWAGLNNPEDSCKSDSHWQRALDSQSPDAVTDNKLGEALRSEEELIRYEYFCSNHLFKDTEYLTHSLNYL